MKALVMAGHLIRRLNQMSTHVFSTRIQEAGFDVTPVQFAALDAILSYPGIDQAGVAAAIAYDRATIGGVIDRLEQKGYVSRQVSPRDRRAREVRATEAGRAAFEEILPIVTALQEELLAELDAGEREAFLRLARKAIGPAMALPPQPD
ncbi:MarR family transcriptional regulator [Oceanicola sp. D3]|uniref:MarR family winged helix-turn-helix transcriptional regulator n=1 Tax=Oceanicola sp. D3 TaxID=2587163 RepID=UPI00111F7413|nr:MarR family transcriptional regulator [Oceanicola sp. D3]QDC10753.1 MarR family transcriptional regulator [Oceanicola sp. D3]